MIGQLPGGTSIILDLRDPAHAYIAFYGIAEAGTSALVRRLLTPGSIMMDVGANAGYYSLLAYDGLGSEVTVHAFEPNPALVDAFRTSVHISGADDTIRVNQTACGSTRGVAQLWMSNTPEQYAFATLEHHLAWSDQWRSFDVDVIDLDSYCEEHDIVPDLIKMDIEGHEIEGIKGMTSLLERGRPTYFICEVVEGHNRPDPATIIAMLSEFGYRCYHVADDGSLEAADDRREIANVCFVAPGQTLPREMSSAV
jgi:FkbM family methyltransferase